MHLHLKMLELKKYQVYKVKKRWSKQKQKEKREKGDEGKQGEFRTDEGERDGVCVQTTQNHYICFPSYKLDVALTFYCLIFFHEAFVRHECLYF